MESELAGTAALVTGASSGIGAATARRLAGHGASIVLVGRRRERLEALAAEIGKAGGTALAVEADITDRTQAEAAVQQTAGRFGRLDILVNNAGLMLLGPVAGADPEEWDRMIAINVQGLLYTTRAALPHLLRAAEDGPRRVADIVNISSIAGRVAWNGYGVYNFTKFGVNGFTESLRQEVTQRHVRVGVVEPGGVATELGSHNKPQIRNEMIDPFYEQMSSPPTTSPIASPTWSAAPATLPSASCGSCPLHLSDRIRGSAKASALTPDSQSTSCTPARWMDKRPAPDEQRRLRLTRVIGSLPRPARPVPIDSGSAQIVVRWHVVRNAGIKRHELGIEVRSQLLGAPLGLG